MLYINVNKLKRRWWSISHFKVPACWGEWGEKERILNGGFWFDFLASGK
jgi:hypothetical protein